MAGKGGVAHFLAMEDGIPLDIHIYIHIYIYVHRDRHTYPHHRRASHRGGTPLWWYSFSRRSFVALFGAYDHTCIQKSRTINGSKDVHWKCDYGAKTPHDSSMGGYINFVTRYRNSRNPARNL